MSIRRMPYGRLVVLLVIMGLVQVVEVLAFKVKNEGHSDTKHDSRLYTPPDPSATGGLRGHVTHPPGKLLAAFAIPVGDLARVYKAELPIGGSAFEFLHLPTAKYDLLLVFRDAFYEGICLNRAASTLTTNDLRSINEILSKSEPFFEIKKIHRCEGNTGAAGGAHCILQELRARPIVFQDATMHTDIQIRTIKMAHFEDVGPNWQLLVTREVVRQEVLIAKEHPGLLPHFYCPDQLGSIRVVDTVKDLGGVELPKPK